MAKKSYQQRNLESIRKTGKTLYQRRVESGLSRGLTAKQARGHARNVAGVRPVPSGYVKNIKTKQGRTVGQMIHAKQESTFRKQLERMTDGTGLLIRVYGPDMSVTAKGSGKGGGINAGDLKAGIASRVASGMDWIEAFEDAIVEYADGLYDDDSSEVDFVPQQITDFVMYTMY